MHQQQVMYVTKSQLADNRLHSKLGLSLWCWIKPPLTHGLPETWLAKQVCPIPGKPKQIIELQEI